MAKLPRVAQKECRNSNRFSAVLLRSCGSFGVIRYENCFPVVTSPNRCKIKRFVGLKRILTNKGLESGPPPRRDRRPARALKTWQRF